MFSNDRLGRQAAVSSGALVLHHASLRRRAATIIFVAGAGGLMVTGSSFLAADAFDAYTNKWLQDTGTGAGGGISSQMVEDQPGPGRCEGDFAGIIAGVDPHWTRINVDKYGQQLYADNTHPSTPIVKAEGQT